MRCWLIVTCIQVVWGAPQVAQLNQEGLLLAQVRVEARRRKPVCRAGPEQYAHKVFLHSLPKCATTSTGYALQELGYKDCGYEPDHWFQHVDAINTAYDLVWAAHSAHYNNISVALRQQVRSLLADFKKDSNHCQSFSDWPIGHASWSFPLIIKHILWPDSRFIWIDRPFESWYESLRKHEEAHPEIFDGHYTPKGKAKEEHQYLRDEFMRFSREEPDKALVLDIRKVDWNPIKDYLFGDSCKAPDLPYPAQNVRSGQYVHDGEGARALHTDIAREQSDHLSSNKLNKRFDFSENPLAVFEQLKGRSPAI